MNEEARLMPNIPGVVYRDHEDVTKQYIFNGIYWQLLRGRDIEYAVQTISGRFFWPLEPHIEDVSIEDIVHGIARECRFGNHTPYHYSVAWHSVALSSVVPDHLKKWALIHDVTEAYLRDLPKPLKKHPKLSEYNVIENNLMTVLAEYFGMPETSMPEELKEYDDDMANCELLVLFGNIGEAKIRARGFSDDYITKVLKWERWIKEYTEEEAKLIWLAQYEELFDDNSTDHH